MTDKSGGYSGTPLPKKLGLKDGQRVLFINLPEAQTDLLLAREFCYVKQVSWEELKYKYGPFDIIHGFANSREQLVTAIIGLRDRIERNGTIWVSWPKKASRVETDMNEDVVRELALPIGLVDVKVCAVDAVWSGLKLVIRKELR